MQTKLIIANWKSNKDIYSIKNWFEEISKALQGVQNLEIMEIIIAPPYPFLQMVKDEIEKHNLPFKISVQDLSSFPAGKYTGAVSGVNLKGLSVSHSILGHSERRRYFRENHQDIALKVEQSIEAGIKPVLCIDKSYLEEQAGVLKSEHLDKVIVAYEPLAAIGSGNGESVGQVSEVIKKVKQIYSSDTKVIYGGSVDEFNVNEYLLVSDGVLVGTAALDPIKFANIIKNYAT